MICNFENCKNETKDYCGRCNVVFYCGQAHQKRDWRNHRQVCGSFVTKQRTRESEKVEGLDNNLYSEDHENVPIGFAYLEAGRNLECGSVVVEELPLFQLPCIFVEGGGSEIGTESADSKKQGEIRPCVACGVNDAPNSCEKCQWPVCGLKCEKAKVHAENECGLFQRKRIKFNPLKVDESLQVLGINRLAGFKAKSSREWKNLLHTIEFCESVGKENQVDTEEKFKRILGLIKKKSIYRENRQIEEEDEDDSDSDDENSEIKFREHHQAGLFLYRAASQFTHSCRPNCTWYLEPPAFGNEDLTFKIRVHAVRPIKKGELLTVSHLDDFGGTISKIRQGTWERASLLHRINPHRFGSGAEPNSESFLCRCSRCKSPSELNSFISAISCSDCTQKESDRPGVFLPDPIPDSSFDSMRCSKCEKTASVSCFKPQLDDIQTRLIEAEGIGHEPFYAIIKENQDTGFLHSNHWLMSAAMSGFIQQVGANRQHFIQAGVSCTYEQWMASREKPDFQKLTLEYVEHLVELDSLIFGDVWSHKKAAWKLLWAQKVVQNVQNCVSFGALEFEDFATFRRQLEQAIKWLADGIAFYSKIKRGSGNQIVAMERMIRTARGLKNHCRGARGIQNEMLSRFNILQV